MRRHLSPATVLSALALFISLGGGAYAASLPRNSVGTPQLKGNAVTSAKVKDGSLQRADFAAGQIPSIQGSVRGEAGPTGPQGPQGEKGDTGATGAAGATGPQGLRGFTGEKGAQGDKGESGKDGAAGKDGAQGPAGADGIGLDGFFGTGADGDATLNGTPSLTRDFYYDDLTIAANANLNTNGFRLFVAGTLTLGSNARIQRNGNPGGGSGGDALAPGTLGGSGAGTPGGSIVCLNGSVQTNSLGGLGGTTTCGPGGSVSPPSAAEGGSQVLLSAAQAITGRTLDGTRINGGGGGAGASTANGSANGAGGGGAGVVVVAARTIALESSAVISAIGGTGSGSGAGGGGGVVVIVSTIPKPANLNLFAIGGPNGGLPGRALYIN